MRTIGAGVGAGLVSALLIAVVARATPLALMLFLLAPLPILIVSLGWDQRAGLIGVIVGALCLGLGVRPMTGLGFLVSTGLPAWWLAYLALLGRPKADGTMEWYPLGTLLAWIVVTAGVTTLAGALTSGDYATFRQNARQIGEVFLHERPGGGPLEPEARRQLADAFAGAAPFLAGQGAVALLTLYLWLGAKIVQVSGRLPRPWPALPGTAMPRAVLVLIPLGLALALLGGYPGVLGLALLGSLLAGLALQGLALVHQRSAALKARFACLATLYGMIVLSQGVILLPVALVGLIDVVFGLRGRRPAATPGPPPPSFPP